MDYAQAYDDADVFNEVDIASAGFACSIANAVDHDTADVFNEVDIASVWFAGSVANTVVPSLVSNAAGLNASTCRHVRDNTPRQPTLYRLHGGPPTCEAHSFPNTDRLPALPRAPACLRANLLRAPFSGNCDRTHADPPAYLHNCRPTCLGDFTSRDVT